MASQKERRLRRSRTRDERKPSGFPLIWWPGRPSSPRPRHASPNRLQAAWVEGYSDNRTVYRKESSACGEAARAMRGNHLGFLSFGGQGGRVQLGRDTRLLRPPCVATGRLVRQSEPYTGKRAAPAAKPHAR